MSLAKPHPLQPHLEIQVFSMCHTEIYTKFAVEASGHQKTGKVRKLMVNMSHGTTYSISNKAKAVIAVQII